MKIEELVEKLNMASAAYYNGESIMSDKEWDEMYDELVRLEKETGIILPNSPTQKVGADTTSVLQKVKHEFPALSLAKTKDVNEIVKVMAEGEKESEEGVVLMWKCDGLTVQATYENGKLIQAATRGNGEIGEDITHNAPYINGLPLEIAYKGKLVVRGEAMISYEEFERINSEIEDEDKYKNPRNLVSGTIRLDDSSENKGMRGRKVDFFAFKVVYAECSPFFFNQLEWLKESKFNVVPHELFNSDKLKTGIESWSEEKYIKAFGYAVDGLVIALNDTSFSETQPATNKCPSRLVGFALKWADETVETVLRDIEWSASRTGLLNPVAVFDPVELCGTTVSRASIHNVSYIMDKNLHIGDRITIYKANMIIPQIDSNLDELKYESVNVGNADLFGPKCCPVCGGKINYSLGKDNTVSAKCPNNFCPAKKIGKFVHFVERDCMNIDGMSEATITTFVEHGFLKEFADFFHLDRYEAEIKALDGFGEKSYLNIVKAAEKARESTFVKFIHACGIPNVGMGQAKLLAPAIINTVNNNPDEYFAITSQSGLIDALTEMVYNEFDFTSIDGFGEVISKSIIDWVTFYLVDPIHLSMDKSMPDCEILNLLDEITFTDVYTDYIKDNDSSISGKTFVVTGDVHIFKNRAELQAKVEELGGKVSGSVSKNTDYLINNDITSTSGKNQKAKELGIPIITEEEFVNML